VTKNGLVSEPVWATGIALVINAQIDVEKLDESWRAGPLWLGFLQSGVPDPIQRHPRQREDRATTLAPPLPSLLYGVGARWHRTESELALRVGDATPVVFKVLAVEILVVSPKVLPRTASLAAVVIAHLDHDSALARKDLAMAVREGLREKSGHDVVLDVLENNLQPGVIRLAKAKARPEIYDRPHSDQSLATAWLDEGIRPVYPIFTVVDGLTDNDRILHMRELATGEPIGLKVDKDLTSRLDRARGDVTVLNDSADAMILRFGATFGRPLVSDMDPGWLKYLVSATYVDLIALSRLEALVLAEYVRSASAFAGMAGERASHGQAVESLLDLTQLRLRLLAYDTSYGKSSSRQSRTNSAISSAARARAETDQLSAAVRQDIAGLVEASKLQDEVAAEKQRQRSNRLNAIFATLVAVFSLVTVPATVVQVVSQVYGVSGAGLIVALWISFGVVAAFVGVVGVLALADGAAGIRNSIAEWWQKRGA
jgi:hypothetical protein